MYAALAQVAIVPIIPVLTHESDANTGEHGECLVPRWSGGIATTILSVARYTFILMTMPKVSPAQQCVMGLGLQCFIYPVMAIVRSDNQFTNNAHLGAQKI